MGKNVNLTDFSSAKRKRKNSGRGVTGGEEKGEEDKRVKKRKKDKRNR